MVIADEMKDAVDHKQDEHFLIVETESIGLTLRCFYGDDQVSEHMGVQTRKLLCFHGEGKDIGRFIPMQVLPIQLLNLRVVDEDDAEFGIRKCQFGQYFLGYLSYFS